LLKYKDNATANADDVLIRKCISTAASDTGENSESVCPAYSNNYYTFSNSEGGKIGGLEVRIDNEERKNIIKFLKTDSSSAKKGLASAEFKITQVQSQANLDKVSGGVEGTEKSGNDTGTPLGEVEFTGLPDGYYLTEETEAPNGYTKSMNRYVVF
jgi:hypothetical protein